MSQATLALSGGFSVAVALLYLYVGYRVSSRKVPQDVALAQNLFVVWWYARGAAVLLVGVQVFLYLGGALPLRVYQGFQHLNTLLTIVALWGLLYYLVFIYTGSRRPLGLISAFYVVFYAWLILFVVQTPEALADDGWALDPDPPLIPPSGLNFGVLLIALLGPQIGAGIALLRLFVKVDDFAQKYRIVVVGTSILVYFGIVLLGAVTGLNQASTWALVTHLVAMVTALAILAAYQPPKWVQHRYGVAPIDEGGF